ncbi:MAG: hypothetical protein PHR96_04290 [Clostridia bacterium]|nr:hypothetical protein [Clostridia bacterium]
MTVDRTLQLNQTGLTKSNGQNNRQRAFRISQTGNSTVNWTLQMDKQNEIQNIN